MRFAEFRIDGALETACRRMVALLAALSVLGLPAPAASAPPTDPKAGKVLSFSEEFDSLSLYDGKTGRWTPRFSYAGPNDLGSRTLPANGEEQIYVDPSYAGPSGRPLGLNPFLVEKGVLTIQARRAPTALLPDLYGKRYTSGLLTTRDSFTQTYGYFEIRARTPKGKGLWPAFWLLRADGRWPPEIDVLEVLGHQTQKVHHALHWSKAGKHVARSFTSSGFDSAQGWRTYGLDWSPRFVRWYIDGRKVAEAPTPPDLHEPMYLLVNLAVGGHWPGKADPSALPGGYQVDYVRAWRAP